MLRSIEAFVRRTSVLLGVVALVHLSFVPVSAQAAGPGHCFASCYHQYHVCWATHFDPPAGAGAHAFCHPQLLDCFNLCNVVAVLGAYGILSFLAPIGGGGDPGDLDPKVADVVYRGLSSITRVHDRGFERAKQKFGKALEKLNEAHGLAQSHPDAAQLVPRLDALIANSETLQATLGSFLDSPCHHSSALGFLPAPPLQGSFSLSQVKGPVVEDLTTEFGLTGKLARNLDSATKLVSRGDSLYARKLERVAVRFEKLGTKVQRLSEGGFLDPQLAVETGDQFTTTTSALLRGDAVRTCADLSR